MHNCWDLKRPSVLLSCLGSADQFDMEPSLCDRFKRGFVSAAGCMGAWVLTSGLNAGVVSLVGGALSVKNAASPDNRLPLIGVASLDALSHGHREALHGKDRREAIE